MYTDAKTTVPVPIHLTPSLLTQAQCRYLQLVGIRIRRVLNRLLRRYNEDPAIQAVLPLTEDEHAWIKQLAPNGFPDPSPVFERFDTNLTAEDPAFPVAFRFLEFNSVGVGCLSFMPVANQLIAEYVVPAYNGLLTPIGAKPSTDPRALLRKLLESHAKALGRKTAVIGFVERRETCVGGADEMRDMSEFLKAQGMATVYCDPRELEMRDGEVCYKDTVLDVLYRDFTLSEVVSIEKHGGKIGAMKAAFQRNQVVSSLVGEFDHKSVMELLSNPEFARYFTPSQRRTVQSFILWTRLMRERKTIDPAGKEVDLPQYAKTHRESLVLKPNRSYGGTDVVIGKDVAQPVWEEAVAKSLAQPDTCVVQEYIGLPRMEFIGPNDPQSVSNEFVTIGFIATNDGISFLGRSSPERIVNITRGGSLVPMFVVK